MKERTRTIIGLVAIACSGVGVSSVMAQGQKLSLEADVTTEKVVEDSLRSRLSFPANRSKSGPIASEDKSIESRPDQDDGDPLDLDHPQRSKGSDTVNKDEEEGIDDVDVRRLIGEQTDNRVTIRERAFSNRALQAFRPHPLKFDSPPKQVAIIQQDSSLKTIEWINPAPVNQPTYFDDIDLERYGHAYPFQTIRSGLRFAEDLLFLPIEAWRHPPCSAVYQSGLARPGDPACPIDEDRFRR